MSDLKFEVKKPKAILEFLERFGVKGTLPAAFLSPEGEYLVEIQYLFEDCWSRRFNKSNNLLRLGVNTDGWDLLVNICDDELVILQDEMGDIDTIDITIFDLLSARVKRI